MTKDVRYIDQKLTNAKKKLKNANKLPVIQAPSTAVLSTTLEKHIGYDQKIYYDKLALKMFDKMNACTPDEYSGTLLAELSSCLEKDKTTNYFSHVLTVNKNENTFSAILSELLNQHLGLGEMAYHHLPTRDHEFADIYVLTTNDGFPDFPLLVSDLKLLAKKMDMAIKETHAYALTISNVSQGYFPKQVLLGLAGTPHEYVLYLYRTCQSHIHPVELCKFFSANFEKLLPSISACLSVLLDDSEVKASKLSPAT